MSEPIAIVIDTDVLPGADGMYRHDVLSEIRLPNQAELYLNPDPRVAELEAVLRECRDEILARAWGLPYNLDEVVTKIDEVLPKTLG